MKIALIEGVFPSGGVLLKCGPAQSQWVGNHTL